MPLDLNTAAEQLADLLHSEAWRGVAMSALRQRRDGAAKRLCSFRYETLEAVRADQQLVWVLTQMLENPAEFLLPGE